MELASERHANMCVPYVCSFITGKEPARVAAELARYNPTGRVRKGWFENEYIPYMQSCGVVLSMPTYVYRGSRIRDLYMVARRCNLNILQGTWLVKVKSHILVVHNGKAYHNQQPGGVSFGGISHNQTIVWIREVHSQVKAYIPYEKSTPTAAPEAFLSYKYARKLEDGRWMASGQMGGRTIRIEQSPYGQYYVQVNGRPQRSVSGSVAQAFRILVNLVKENQGA